MAVDAMAVDTMAAISQKVDTMAAKREFVYKIPCRARAWPSGCIGRVRRASKGILHTKRVHLTRCISRIRERNDGARARKIGRWLGQQRE